MPLCTRILNCISNYSTVASWNSIIRATINRGCSFQALLLYRQMKRHGVNPDNLTFPFVAKACGLVSDVLASETIHTHVVKSPFWCDVFVQTALVDMYVKSGQVNSAHTLFERMPVRDVAAWNAMLMGFSHLGCSDRVVVLFCQMRLEGIMPDSITIISLSQSSVGEKNLGLARSVHCFAIRIGVEVDVSVANTWISVYAKCEDLESAEVVFTGISHSLRTVVSWNSVIAGYAYLEKFTDAVTAFRCMCRDGVRPDLSTMLSLLSSFAHSEALSEGQLMHSLAIKAGFDSDISVSNTLLSLYSKCGDVHIARYCFNNMTQRTSVSWNAMINGYSQKGHFDEALNLFYAMEAAGEEPNAVTVVAVLSACSQVGALEIGKSINRYAIAHGFGENVIVCNALIDMYAKCGGITEARRLFENMSGRTIVSWTTMITGHAVNGGYEEALGLFSQMLESGMKPNHITFLAVLQACVHAGYLEEGWKCFNLMASMYHVKPTLEHYACMVDLLGRRGKLREALEFILKMPVEPDAGVWGTLLSACLTHHEIEVGEYAAAHLFELEADTSASYVAMANLYAAEGRWEGMAKIRSIMKRKLVRKIPGQSLVQVNGKVHAFRAEDRCLPTTLHIYEVLDVIAFHLKEERHEIVLDPFWDMSYNEVR